jgi:site-specific DNA-cytosine methylase
MKLQGRDYVRIGEAARILGVAEATLRNWHAKGRLVPDRNPVNGYRLYRVADVHRILREAEQGLLEEQAHGQLGLPFGAFEEDVPVSVEEVLPDCHWSPAVALDPKHRPQQWNAPSSTVRRDWRKYPQEAHVIDATGSKYRRFSVEEIAILQGFSPKLARTRDLTDRERIAAIGNAVPPPLAKAVIAAIDETHGLSNRTSLEICAGIGGLAEGGAARNLDHLLLVDADPVAGALLRANRPWASDRVVVSDVREVDLRPFKGQVGILSGGPPCQPWSRSGRGLGESDERDLLGSIHEFVADLEPEVFLFENVPGLASQQNRGYLRKLVARLRAPAKGLRYGVLVGRLNAADFGVPQDRERVFFLGLRDAPASKASACFAATEKMRTHARLGRASSALRSWRTVGEALGSRKDPGGWRRWIGR